ncbi:hypothetical protein MAR002J2_00075 [Escherichia phage vB_Eco_mar001J1]|uniref:Uncharacterized protein n=1 Tax=Escherichia phage vB_Eco_mar001J1 TaxID=2419760 RepID=A0A3P4A7F6_9CAUD|nr:hypothetical protein HOV61_gp75 [Escherichia phage vB_Eco_mar001J1]YP_009824739.1 hypothetical protein HOV63_gp49 [Escherichia phage vB_Eco_mar001J1]QGH77058.1 hypothetical protein [Escherichia phage BEK12A]QGH77502.1 hypothetical protein [Escherichia phage BEK26]VCU43620.1 hypothetical protein MAR001J1_00049 [Escherichia phage vB_Eco_mar001J1]VCU43724.1 hypothetical protein MAR002J2_00075 [Escherichia phage vB_Eco_mar001J1]
MTKKRTIKCTKVYHHMNSVKPGQHFKEGKRYEIIMGRVLGAVAGYVVDAQGEQWTLERREVGFKCAIAEFQGKYF